MTRWVHYGRFSTDMQSAASIEDQLRVCRERCDLEGWIFSGAYEDRAMSGASRLRPGYQRLLQDARSGRFDIVVAEALDRLSRDLEDIAHLYKQLTFSNVRLFTLSEGWISEIQIGLGGTVGALYIRQLAEKTHRGMRGRVEAGKSGGGLTYGYDVVRTTKPDGTVEVGGRRINEEEARIVRRIFEAYASGMSPRKIALMLNEEKISGPRDKGWGASTINGNAERGTGIINNALYIGRLVWNKLKYVKDPETGKRRSRVNGADDVIEKSVPDLRIIPDDLWHRVKERQRAVALGPHGARKKPWDRRRPKYLLSGLVRCGCCGGGYVQVSKNRLGCASARNKGLCANRLTIGRMVLEATVLDALKKELMAPDLFKEFCEEFLREVNRARMAATADRSAAKAEVARIRRRLCQIVDAIAEGIPARTLKDELLALEAREDLLIAELSTAPEKNVLLAPGLADIYRDKVADLHAAMVGPESDRKALETIRSLVDRVVLTPENGRLTIDLQGQLAAILKLSDGKKYAALSSAKEQLVMVAGVGFEPTTFRL